MAGFSKLKTKAVQRETCVTYIVVLILEISSEPTKFN
jgi:hypothetical protein